MATFAFFECLSGAAGDMIVAACLDAGVPADYLRQELAKLEMTEQPELHIGKVKRAGIEATAFVPVIDEVHHDQGSRVAHPVADGSHHHHGRNLADIIALIERSGLGEPVKERSCRIFRTLAEAEARVHGTTVDHIHFHEVGGLDAIVDIVGACVAFDYLQIDHFFCSPLVVGGGTVRCQHGIIPVPAPATAEMIKDIDIIATDIRKELLTPTGAAVLTTVAEGFGSMPTGRITAIGYGAGTHDFVDMPNVVRLLIGSLGIGQHRCPV